MMICSDSHTQDNRYSIMPAKFCILFRCLTSHGIRCSGIACGICVNTSCPQKPSVSSYQYRHATTMVFARPCCTTVPRYSTE